MTSIVLTKLHYIYNNGNSLRFQLLNEFVCGIRNEFTKVNSLGESALVSHSLLLCTGIFPSEKYSICQYLCMYNCTLYNVQYMYYMELHEVECKFIRSLVEWNECGKLLHIRISLPTSSISLFLHFVIRFT